MSTTQEIIDLSLNEAYDNNNWSNNYILDPIKYDDYLGSLLPKSMLGDKTYNSYTKEFVRTGNGMNYRKLLQDIVGKKYNETMINLHFLSLLSSPDDNYGLQLDNIGNNLSLSREAGESDEDYRFRLKTIVATRSTYTTVKNITEVLKVVFEDDTMWIKENPNGESACIQLNTNEAKIDFTKALEVLEQIVPAGVRVASLGLVTSLWQDVKDDYLHWGDVNTNATW